MIFIYKKLSQKKMYDRVVVQLMIFLSAISMQSCGRLQSPTPSMNKKNKFEEQIRELASDYTEVSGKVDGKLKFSLIEFEVSTPLSDDQIDFLYYQNSIWDQLRIKYTSSGPSLADITKLNRIDGVTQLFCDHISLEAFEELASMQDLEQFYMSRMNSVAPILSNIENTYNWNAIGIHGAKGVSGNGEAIVRCFPSLNYLALVGTDVNDQDLKHIVELKNLERLLINRTNVTSEGLKHLFSSKSLILVHCDETIVDEKFQLIAPFRFQ